MSQHTTGTDVDFRKVLKSIANLNPHVSLSDIAYLMDMPYDPESFEVENFETIETSKLISH